MSKNTSKLEDRLQSLFDAWDGSQTTFGCSDEIHKAVDDLRFEKLDACVIGLPCEKHGGAVHGREAEELRAGIERLLKEHGSSVAVAHRALICLLDEVDARDSLGFLEAGDALVGEGKEPR